MILVKLKSQILMPSIVDMWNPHNLGNKRSRLRVSMKINGDVCVNI